MDLRKFTATGRPLELNYPTNRAILFLSTAVFLITAIVFFSSGKSFLTSIEKALGFAAGVFFAWAICREIDPDNEKSAFVAAGLALAGSLIYYPPDFAGMIWLMLILRIINRSTGLRATIFDSLIITIITAYLLFRGDWIYGLFSILAFLTDSFVKPVYRRQLYFATFSGILLTIVWIFIGYNSTAENLNLTELVIFLMLTLLYLPFIINSKNINSKGDDTGISLNSRRVQFAQIFSLVLALFFAIFERETGITKMMILWAAMAGIVLYFYFRMIIKTNR